MSRSTRLPGVAACLAVLAFFAVFAAASPSRADAACRDARAQPGSIGERKAADAVFCLINEKRSSHGLPSVDRSGTLNKSARYHTDFMVKAECFAHECRGEPSLSSRLSAVGYILSSLSRWLYGENIAWGERWRGKPKRIVSAWMHSPAHRDILLSPNYDEVGIGVAWGSPTGNKGSRSGTYTADFGFRLF